MAKTFKYLCKDREKYIELCKKYNVNKKTYGEKKWNRNTHDM
jgi:hypothetical protein